MHDKFELIWIIRLLRAMGVVRKYTSSHTWRKPVYARAIWSRYDRAWFEIETFDDNKRLNEIHIEADFRRALTRSEGAHHMTGQVGGKISHHIVAEAAGRCERRLISEKIFFKYFTRHIRINILQ